jgi:hypothetical protein
MSNSASIQSENLPQPTDTGSSRHLKVSSIRSGSEAAEYITVLSDENLPYTQRIPILPDDEVVVKAVSYDLIDPDEPSEPIAQVQVKKGEHVYFRNFKLEDEPIGIPYDRTFYETKNHGLVYHHRPDYSMTRERELAVRRCPPRKVLEARSMEWEVERLSRGVAPLTLGTIGRGDSVLVTQGSQQESILIPLATEGGEERSTLTSGTLDHSGDTR